MGIMQATQPEKIQDQDWQELLKFTKSSIPP